MAQSLEKRRVRAKKWRDKNPGKANQLARNSRWKKQGVAPTRDEPEWCECCGRLPETVLCLDHDHVTLKFRGWICRQCNAAIGQLGDTIEGVQKALAYLKRTQ